jgi:hypothetical protein
MTLRRSAAGLVGALAAWLLLLRGGPDTGETLQAVEPVVASVARLAVPAVAPQAVVAAVAEAPPAEETAPEWHGARTMHGAEAVLGVVEGHVAGDDGEVLDGAFVRALAESGEVHAARTGPDGRFRFVLPVGRVVLSAARYDGVEVQGPDELVSVREGDAPYVALELFSGPAAGAGVSVLEHPDGFEVMAVGRSALDAGLRQGMVVRRIDGQDALSLTPEAAERLLVGREGSVVELEVSDGAGAVQAVAIARRSVDRSLRD